MNYTILISNIITLSCLIAISGMGIYFILESKNRNYTGERITQKDIDDLRSLYLGGHGERSIFCRDGSHLPDHNSPDSGITDKEFYKLKSLYS